MFGIYRTLLAILVVIHHLNWLPIVGQYAVHAFFVLSGFLMTLIMHGNYGYDANGTARFAMNRFLRLYPSYFAVLAITVIAILAIGPDVISGFRSTIFLPSSVSEWAQNLSMIYVAAEPTSVRPRLSPATWALTIELFNYALIAFGVSRSKRVTWIWFIISLGYHVAILLLIPEHRHLYLNIVSGSLPFAMGALLYHYRDFLRAPTRLYDWQIAGGASALVLGLSMLANNLENSGFYGAYLAMQYVNMLVSLAAVAMLIECKGSRLMDKIVGDFSYHIYIAHWIVGAVVFTQFFALSAPTYSMIGLLASGVTVAICIVLSLALTWCIDKPVEKLRRKLRSGT